MWDHGLGGLFATDPVLLVGGLVLLGGVAGGLGALLLRAPADGITRGRPVLFALAALLGAGLFAYFAPGDVAGGDAHAHVARTWLYADAFANEHVFPIWTNRWYLGYPLGLHYGFLYFASSGLLDVLLPLDVFATTKLFLWAAHLVSGLLVFAYVRRTADSDRAAIVAAVVYTFSFLHLGPLLLSGHLPLSLVFLLLPALWLGHAAWEAGELSLLPAAGLLGGGLALALFDHLQYGAFTALAFGVWVLIRGLAVRIEAAGSARTDPAESVPRDGVGAVRSDAADTARAHAAAVPGARQTVALAVASFGVAALLAAWLVIPAWTEGSDLVLRSSSLVEEFVGEASIAGLRDALDLFLWSRVMRDWSYYYVGLVPLVLAVASLVAWRKGGHAGGRRGVLARRGPSDLVALWGTGLVCFGLALVNPRFSPFWLFLVALLAGRGAAALLPLLSRGRGRFVPALLALLLVLDLGPTLLQDPYRVVDNTALRDLKRQLVAERETGRVLELGAGKSALWRSLDVVDTGLSTPFGGIPQAATKALPHAAAVASAAVGELLDTNGTISPATRDGLRLLHVDRLVVPGRPDPITLEGHPAWYSDQIEVATEVDPIEAIDWYSMKRDFDRRELSTAGMARTLARMELDPVEPRAGRILLHRDVPVPAGVAGLASKPEIAGSEQAAASDVFRIDGHRESHQGAVLRYAAPADGYLLLSYAYSPWLRASVDGGQVPTYTSATWLTIVPIPAGEHEVALRAILSPLRVGLLWLAGATLAGLLASTGWGVLGRRRQRKFPR